MVPLRRSVAFIHVLSVWTVGCAGSCAEQKHGSNNRCCEKCRPGEYLKEHCTEHKATVCSPCDEGFFAASFNSFDRCERCQSCHEYAEKCTSTTNAKCLCRSGFLCSNNKCSTCEENKCVAGERVNRTDLPEGGNLIKYSYRCVAACPAHAYFDVKEETCKPRTQCSAIGLAERFPGNKTHNSVCDLNALKGGDSSHMIFGISFLLLSLCFLAILSTVCVKNQRKHEADMNPAFSVHTADFPLPKEECGLQLSILDDYKDRSSLDELHQGETTILCI